MVCSDTGFPVRGGRTGTACVLGVAVMLVAVPGRATPGLPGAGSAETALPGGQMVDPALSFDRDLLALGGGPANTVDLAYFAHKGGQLPGRYVVRVEVNGRPVDDGREVEFRSWTSHPGRLYACVSTMQLAQWWGIRATAPLNAGCPDGGVETLVPYAKETLDLNRRLLSLTVPQAALGPVSRLRTSPTLWDTGLPTLLLNYTYSGNQQQDSGQVNSSDFVRLNGQLNLLGWRIRNDLTGHREAGGDAQWRLSQGYAQHDVTMLGGGQLTVGHTISQRDGGGGESVLFNGVTLSSDTGMLAPAYTHWQPTISGTALSPATVTVRQYGKVIDEQNVPQGPFSLTAFNRSGSGDVSVDIREADGATRHFTLVQATAGALLPRGTRTFSLATGKAANSEGYVDNRFIQAAGTYGVRDALSLTGGVLISSPYQALTMGVTMYAGAWGTLGYVLNAAQASLTGIPGLSGVSTGVSHSLSGSRTLGKTVLDLTLTRSQSPHFYRYAELLSLTGGDDDRTNDTRDSLSLSLSRGLGEWGNLSLSGSRTTVWGQPSAQHAFTLGYTTTVKHIGIGVSVGVNANNGSSLDGPETVGNHTETSVAVTLSLPLDHWLSVGGMSGYYSYSYTDGQAGQQVGFNGSALDGSLTYTASQGISGVKTSNASLGYSGRYGTINGGVNYGGETRSLTYGGSGGLAVHAHGVTPGRSLALDGANALVSIPGVSGVTVGDTVTDWQGYALLSGLTPFDANPVNVDMSTLPGNVELDVSSQNVVPSRGALVSVPFRSKQGYRLLLTLTRSPAGVPFGALVTLRQLDTATLPVTGVVGENGQVYLAGMPAQGRVTAVWGDGAQASCTAAYSLPAQTDSNRLRLLAADCL